jgi:hypothetical protein
MSGTHLDNMFGLTTGRTELTELPEERAASTASEASSK